MTSTRSPRPGPLSGPDVADPVDGAAVGAIQRGLLDREARRVDSLAVHQGRAGDILALVLLALGRRLRAAELGVGVVAAEVLEVLHGDVLELHSSRVLDH